jgi:hypothetical protein
VRPAARAALVLAVGVAGTSVAPAAAEHRLQLFAGTNDTGWISDRLPFDEWTDDALAVLEDDGVGDEGAFGSTAARGGGRTVPAVPPESFDPAELGVDTPTPELHRLLVTGDSLAMPLDLEIARRRGTACRCASRPWRPSCRSPGSRTTAVTC